LRVTTRHSTDVLLIEVQEVANALRLIRERATNWLRVSEVIASIRHSRSTLERRVKASLGRTLKAEITRLRVERANLLLQETDLPVAAVAIRSGFSESKCFCEVFRKSERMTAIAYWQQFTGAPRASRAKSVD
jgi:LacI family transcriptional regulator